MEERLTQPSGMKVAAEEEEKRSNLSAFNQASHSAPVRVTEADKKRLTTNEKNITICSNESLLLQFFPSSVSQRDCE